MQGGAAVAGGGQGGGTHVAKHGIQLVLALVFVQLELALAQNNFQNLKTVTTARETTRRACQCQLPHRVQIPQLKRLQRLVALGALAVDHVREHVADLRFGRALLREFGVEVRGGERAWRTSSRSVSIPDLQELSLFL
jgi:hypothetical protein